MPEEIEQSSDGQKRRDGTTRHAFSLFAALVCLGALVAYLIANREAVTDIWNQQTFVSLGVVGATIFVQWFLGAHRDSLLLGCLSHEVRWYRLYELNAYQLTLNSLPFRLGTLYKAKRLKSDNGIPYSEFGSALLLQSVLVVAGGGLIASWVLLTHSFDDETDACGWVWRAW